MMQRPILMHRLTAIAGTVVLAICCPMLSRLVAQDQDDDADAARLIEILALDPGAAVADVGAGSGA